MPRRAPPAKCVLTIRGRVTDELSGSHQFQLPFGTAVRGRDATVPRAGRAVRRTLPRWASTGNCGCAVPCTTEFDYVPEVYLPVPCMGRAEVEQLARALRLQPFPHHARLHPAISGPRGLWKDALRHELGRSPTRGLAWRARSYLEGEHPASLRRCSVPALLANIGYPPGWESLLAGDVSTLLGLKRAP